MNKRIVGALSALALLAGSGVALSQTVVVAPEQETAIREYVTKQKVESIQPPADLRIEVGSTLPDTVELHTVDVPDVKYRYVVVDNKTVLVDPDTRKIVHIM